MPAGRDRASGTEGRRPKAAREGTRGGRAGRWGLWGFDGCRRSGGTGLMAARDGRAGPRCYCRIVVAPVAARAARSVRGHPPEPVGTGGAEMPTSRSELAAAALAGRIYVAGGIAQLGTTAAFEAYDPATDHWEELPPLPEAVHHLAAAATDRVYVTGGYTICCSARSQSAPGPTTLEARRWTGIADLPGTAGSARHGGNRWQVNIVSGVDRICGSMTRHGSWGCRACRASDAARAHLAVAVLAGKLYAIGGGGTILQSSKSLTRPQTPITSSAPGGCRVAACGNTDHFEANGQSRDGLCARFLSELPTRRRPRTPSAREADYIYDLQHRVRSPGLQRRHPRIRARGQRALQDRSAAGARESKARQRMIAVERIP